MVIKISKTYRPSSKERFMNPKQKEYFRRKLLAWKEQLLKESQGTIESLKGENHVQKSDEVDIAALESDRYLELKTRDRQRKLISKIDAALTRIDDDTYGYCEVSGEPIGLKRLDARPIATLSLEAQEYHERQEKIYSE